MIIKMAVADSEEQYLERFVSVFEEYSEFSLSIYTDAASLHAALEGRKFDIIMGTSLSKCNRKVFEFVDKIVLVDKNDTISNEKMQIFLSQAYIMNEFGHKMCGVINFDMGRETQLPAGIPLIGRIGAVQNAEPDQLVNMLSVNNACSFTDTFIS